MSFEGVLADLRSIYQVDPCERTSLTARLTEMNVQKWSAEYCVSRTVLYDQIALYLAYGFQKGELSFEFCDAVVNDIFAILMSSKEEWPDLFWQVFLAFDEGEYYHGNNREQDPVAAYTRPQIARIVENHPLKKS
jgi:hypothetical protein